MLEEKKKRKAKKMTERWEAEGPGVFVVTPPSEELQKELDEIKKKYEKMRAEKK